MIVRNKRNGEEYELIVYGPLMVTISDSDGASYGMSRLDFDRRYTPVPASPATEPADKPEADVTTPHAWDGDGPVFPDAHETEEE